MKVQQNVSYQEPTIQRLALGQKPASLFNEVPTVTTDYVSLSGHPDLSGKNPLQTVWGDVPLKNPDGTPQMRPVTADVDLTPRSPLKYGAISGGIGASVGALAGLASSASLGVSSGLGALGGALALGGLAGGVAALLVRNDHVKLVWNTHQIADHKLLGYHEYVGIGEKDGKHGYFHRFVPDVQETIIGSFQTPQAVHYKQEARS